MKWLIRSLLVPLLVLATQQAAHADLKILWDCYLPDSPRVSCNSLRDVYFSSMTFLTSVATVDESEVMLSVRSDEIAGGTNYKLVFTGRYTLHSVSIVESVSASVTADAAMLAVLGRLQACTASYLAVKKVGSTDSKGEVTIVVGDPASNSEQPPPNNDATRWYIQASVSSSISKATIDEKTGRMALTANWSDPNWRVNIGADAFYQKLKIPVAGGDPVKAQIFRYATTTIISYSVAEHWSVAVIPNYRHSPGENLRNDYGVLAGLEWELVPFKTGSIDHTLSVRYMIGAKHQDYIDNNILDKGAYTFLLQRLQAFFAWHFSKELDVSATVGASLAKADLDYLGGDANLSATWRITDNLTLSPSISYSLRRKIINQPLSPDTSNPLQELVGGQDYGDKSYSFMISLTYVFGNALLNTQDRRWSGQ